MEAVVVLRVGGEIDLLSCAAFQAGLARALFGTVDAPTRHLLVDFTEVTFCSAHGFGLLSTTALAAAVSGTGYALCGLRAPLLRAGTMLWGDHRIVCHPDVAVALADMRGRQCGADHQD